MSRRGASALQKEHVPAEENGRPRSIILARLANEKDRTARELLQEKRGERISLIRYYINRAIPGSEGNKGHAAR